MIHRPSAAGLALLLALSSASATRVEVTTRFGSFQIELLDEVAPATVANFLNYVNDGDYDGTFLHRSVVGFVIQGGGYLFADGNPVEIETDPPVANEFSRSNLRGTVAMAKLSGDPDSATSQWFINLVDNSASLDTSNGGFTVFGEVAGDGMAVVDTIVAQSQVWNFGGAFTNLPLVGYPGSGAVADEDLVTTTIRVVPESDGFRINPGLAGSWFNPQTPGQGWLVDVIQLEDGGLELFVAWFTYDNDAPPVGEDLSFGSDQHRWFTAQGPVVGDTATLTLRRNSGGLFNDPRDAPGEAVGTLTIRFIDCTSAVIAFAFSSGEGGSGEIDAVRLSPDVFCQASAASTR